MVQSLYDWLYRDMTLRTAGLILGAVLVATHLWAYFNTRWLGPWLREAPRNKQVGVALLSVALLGSLVLVAGMDLGEFHSLRKFGLIALPIGFGLTIAYMDELLTARALGMVLLLAACPVLDAAFLEAPVTRLLLPALAYVWIGFGMFWVGKPYLLRDQIGWLTADEGRLKKFALAGAAYGAVLLVCALAFWG